MIDNPTTTLVVQLRAASAADQPTIKEMVRGARLNPIGLDWERFTLAVTGENKIIGCAQLKTHRGGVLELASLVVVKGWRRKGVARRLIDHLKETAGPPLWLMCSSRLTTFYEPFGFRQVRLGQAMPAYYRRLLRMAYLFNRLAPSQETLAVMVWDGKAS
jgi:N-acetylglutamate synthase-like GNAT family acetyltransferase